MRAGGRIFIVAAVVAGLLLAGAPSATARWSWPKIDDIASPIAAGATFQVDVDTLNDGQRTEVLLQVRTANGWRTLVRQPGVRWAGTRRFTIKAPGTTQTMKLRALETLRGRALSTSSTATVDVWATGLTATHPHAAQVAGQPGDWFQVGKDELLFGPTLSGADAWKVVSADTLVEKPAPGWSIVLGTVNYKGPVTEWDQMWPFISVSYLGNDGNAYRPGDELSPGGYCRYSLDLSDKTGDPKYDLYPVAAGVFPQFYPCAVVPDSAISGGVWQIKSGSVTLRPQVQYAQAASTPTPVFPKGLTPLNPYAAQTPTSSGDWFEIPFFAGNYGVLFGETIAGEVVWNQLNGPYNSTRHPEPGWSIVLVTATLQNRTDHSSAPFLHLMGPDFVGSDGVRYVGYDSLSPGGSCPWTPTDLFLRELDARSSFTFTGCAVVPDSAIAGGVWQIGPVNPFVIPSKVYAQALR